MSVILQNCTFNPVILLLKTDTSQSVSGSAPFDNMAMRLCSPWPLPAPQMHHWPLLLCPGLSACRPHCHPSHFSMFFTTSEPLHMWLLPRKLPNPFSSFCLFILQILAERWFLREAFPGISCPSQSLTRLSPSVLCSQWTFPLLRFSYSS